MTMHHTEETLETGSLLDRRFRIERLLGRGGYGEVYEATQLSVQRKVAIKVLRTRLTRDSSAIERFQNEARYACQLKHPNTVVYYDSGWDDDKHVLYLAMEYLAGKTLSDHLKEHGTLSLDETADLLSQICGAIGEAHSVGLIHRDIKPNNIMLTERAGRSNFIKVIDFGIAKVIEQDEDSTASEPLTETGAIIGTPHYMSPEQIQSDRHTINQRSDIYAIGCLTYKMLTGVPPFRGRNTLDIATRHLTEVAQPMSAMVTNTTFPRPLELLIQRTLSKSADERPPTALAFIEEFQQSIIGAQNTSIPGHPTFMDQPAVSTQDIQRYRQNATTDNPNNTPKISVRLQNAPPPKHTTILTPVKAPPTHSKRTLALIATAIVLLLIIFTSAIILIQRESKDTPNTPTTVAENTPSKDTPQPPPEDTTKDTPKDPPPSKDTPTTTDNTPPPKTPPNATKNPPPQNKTTPSNTQTTQLSQTNPQPKTNKKPNITIPEPSGPVPTPTAKTPAPTPTSPKTERAPATSNTAILVTVYVQPWGTVSIGGKQGDSRVTVRLKPGPHTVTIKQRAKTFRRRIQVVPGKTKYSVKI